MWIFIVVVVALWAWINFWADGVSRKRYFRGRAVRSHGDFGLEEFPECPELASAIRKKLEPSMGELALLIEASDLLCHEFILGEDFDIDEFLYEVEDAFKVSLESFNAPEVWSLGKLITFVASARA